MPRDISGNLIPAQPISRSTVDRIIAVPPIRDVPNELAQEFFLSGYSNLAAGGAAFLPLTNPETTANFAVQVPDKYRGRIDAISLFCPDMVTALLPYLYWQLLIAGQPANAWNRVPIFPRAGVASVGLPAVIDLLPGAVMQMNAMNTDAVNTHFLGVYLHGWYWPKDEA